MGTRNLTCVIVNGEYKIAQYGQWDGYPSGQGVTVLEFLNNVKFSNFKEKLKNVKFLTDEEVDEIEKKYASEWMDYYPQLSRDHGAEILNLVNDGADKLIDHSSFAGGIGCQYCYIIDFDENVFESYSSSYGNPRDVENVGRLKNMYLMKSYKLDELPTEKEYLDYLEPSNDEG